VSKVIKKSVLDAARWWGVRVGSSVVSYCKVCECQRTHRCVDSFWEEGELWFVFVCDFCRFGGL